MPTIFNDNEIDKKEEVFVDDEKSYDIAIKTELPPETNIGIDIDETLLKQIADGVQTSQFDISKISSMTQLSQERNDLYNAIDAMAQDPTISAVLETYAEDSTEYNDNGRIMWAESSDAEISKFVNFLLDSINVDKKIYKWAHCLCKYGDVYLRLFRKSDYEDPIFDKKGEKENLQEDVKVVAYRADDKFVHYVEMVPNPAEMFELTRFGKTYGYIKAPVYNTQTKNNPYSTTSFTYDFKVRDIDIYGATDYVHGCLEENDSRTTETVNLFYNKTGDAETDTKSSYSVRRGQSLLQSSFKAWRERMLLENSMLLNRITKSSIVRVINVEVGDMPKERVGPHLQSIKSLMEQKTALNTGNSMEEYTNPGPMENNVYVPTRNGQGNITTQQIGGDVDVKGLADVDYFNKRLFGSLRIPQQYFGFTDDNAGFSGGESLALISSRYAKMVKRIQNVLIQMVTDAVNILLLDRGLDSYVNNFNIKMQAPTTKEEIDRKQNVSNAISVVGDVMNLLTDIEDNTIKLKILKSLIANALPNPEVVELLQDEIEKPEQEETPIHTDMPEDNAEDRYETSGYIPPDDREVPPPPPAPQTQSNTEEEGPRTDLSDVDLPTPSELDKDFTDNTEFQQ